MGEEELLFEREGNRAWITFNRPKVRNAVTFGMYTRLEELCDRLAEDDELRVVILRGAGGEAFVAGTDITQFHDFRTEQDPLDYEQRIDRLLGKLERLPVPTIAMIEGYCVGGGAAIALACDFRYTTPELQFGIPIARTLGNCLSLDNISRMVDLLGPARTKEALMLAKLLDAETAQQVGLVNDVFDAGVIRQEVEAVADRLAGLAPLTLRAIKEAVRRTQLERRAEAEQGRDLILSCYMSEDFREGVTAFTEKRRPQWRGR
ncbi:enoyl-CoA hydratase/carnithine racemase [Natronocella acetinitrilica]|jgi:enoyl-CoA hydratase|uniref:Enoyl-CoA hydratase/carnithine racemase n=1 Tax=Natronocella acetinitrilica TaxID=414046 RepID=A0AAE3G6U2_9GAMM|nr:enoyl-CoA hydratase/isomerase family protein [Natronocella acetinitrilica]MCP1674922.1 enoyl-CoA hydratase/carnithine racemase [Natronocella acetinitrilica]